MVPRLLPLTLSPDPQVTFGVVFSNTHLCYVTLKIYMTMIDLLVSWALMFGLFDLPGLCPPLQRHRTVYDLAAPIGSILPTVSIWN